ncbi:hypothetical protein K9L16_01200 [Candidatus Pacearchaeota archaeon]|nr:hypothetical protein [Candidatus Pacearchaeota archaeon]
MSVKNFSVFGFLLLVSMSLVSAGTIELNIQAVDDHLLNINFLNPDRANQAPISFGSLNVKTKEGLQIETFTDEFNAESFEMHIYLLDSRGDKVNYKRFDDIENNQKVSLVATQTLISLEENYNPAETTTETTNTEATSNPPNQSINEVVEEETNTSSPKDTVATTETNSSVKEVSDNSTGFNPSSFALIEDGFKSISRNLLYYILGGVGLFFILFFGLKLVNKSLQSSGQKSVFSGFSGGDSISDIKSKLAKTQKELKELKKELDEKETEEEQSAHEKKILEVKKRLMEDQKELLKLKGDKKKKNKKPEEVKKKEKEEVKKSEDNSNESNNENSNNDSNESKEDNLESEEEKDK